MSILRPEDIERLKALAEERRRQRLDMRERPPETLDAFRAFATQRIRDCEHTLARSLNRDARERARGEMFILKIFTGADK